MRKRQVDVITPAWPGTSFFQNGEPFRKPSRHLVIGHAERHGVRELVPQRRGPVELATGAGGRRIDDDDRSEADSQRTQPGQADGANREIGVRGKHLDANWRWRTILIELRQTLVGLVGDAADIQRQHVGFRPLDEDLETLGVRRPVPGKRVEEVECVLYPHVVGVARKSALQILPAGLDVSESKLIETQKAIALP